MADQFGSFANDASNLQQQLTPAQILQQLRATGRLAGASAQAAVSGVAGMPGDLSDMLAGHVAGLPIDTRRRCSCVCCAAGMKARQLIVDALRQTPHSGLAFTSVIAQSDLTVFVPAG
jgi:hypothetical protein